MIDTLAMNLDYLSTWMISEHVWGLNFPFTAMPSTPPSALLSIHVCPLVYPCLLMFALLFSSPVCPICSLSTHICSCWLSLFVPSTLHRLMFAPMSSPSCTLLSSFVHPRLLPRLLHWAITRDPMPTSFLANGRLLSKRRHLAYDASKGFAHLPPLRVLGLERVHDLGFLPRKYSRPFQQLVK